MMAIVLEMQMCFVHGMCDRRSVTEETIRRYIENQGTTGNDVFKVENRVLVSNSGCFQRQVFQMD